MLTYVTMSISHYESACALWKITEGVGISKGDSKEAVASYLARNPGMSFVCLDGGHLAGTILCGTDGRRGFIYHLAVDSKYRGRGIGKELVKRSLEKLRGAGIERCLIMVQVSNSTGNDFWTKTGWTKRDDIQMYSLNLD